MKEASISILKRPKGSVEGLLLDLKRAFGPLAFAALSVCILGCTKPEPELIPREVLFGNPEKTRAQISPDGTRLAYLAPLKGVLNVWVQTIGKEDEKAVTHDRDRGIRRYFWAEDGKHIVYLQDVGGNENWRLYSVNLETGQTGDLTPYEDVQVRIIAHNKHFPNELLILMNKEDAKVRDAYHLDLKTGDLTLVAKNPGNFRRWVADTNLKIRGALEAREDGGVNLLVRESEGAPWKTLLTWNVEDSASSRPLGFTKDGRSIRCIGFRNANAGRLVRIDVETGAIDIIAEDPRYDVTWAMIHPDTYEVQAAALLKARREWIVLDESIQDDFRAIRGLDRGDFRIEDRDHADATWLVSYNKDDGPVSYYAYNRKTGRGTFLFDHKPKLNSYTLASMEPISFTARDGLIIHGYITYPVGKDRRNLPMVLLVHGGPWGRDTWGYDAAAQWLANRGYVCLQVNFRGSWGYGKDFLNAGNKEWAGKMHNDLVDAVNWAVEQGVADPERVAIAGASYGGYAALVGATFTPDLFCCAVDVVGISNLLTWIESIPPYWSTLKEMLYKRIGNPETEADLLKSRSPLFKADRIKIPLFIAQGANDPRVPKEESDQIVEALRERGIKYTYMLIADEGHGFAKPENRLEVMAAEERFLAEHLGGRCEEAGEVKP